MYKSKEKSIIILGTNEISSQEKDAIVNTKTQYLLLVQESKKINNKYLNKFKQVFSFFEHICFIPSNKLCFLPKNLFLPDIVPSPQTKTIVVDLSPDIPTDIPTDILNEKNDMLANNKDSWFYPVSSSLPDKTYWYQDENKTTSIVWQKDKYIFLPGDLSLFTDFEFSFQKFIRDIENDIQLKEYLNQNRKLLEMINFNQFFSLKQNYPTWALKSIKSVSKFKKLITDLKTQQKKIKDTLIEKEEEKEKEIQKYSYLWETGEELEKSIYELLKKNNTFQNIEIPNEKKEDLICINDNNYFVFEIKGVSGHLTKKMILQARSHAEHYAENNPQAKIFPILILNYQREIDISKRKLQFETNLLNQEIKGKICIVTTKKMYELQVNNQLDNLTDLFQQTKIFD